MATSPGADRTCYDIRRAGPLQSRLDNLATTISLHEYNIPNSNMQGNSAGREGWCRVFCYLSAAARFLAVFWGLRRLLDIDFDGVSR
jgi:hypothetical protein